MTDLLLQETWTSFAQTEPSNVQERQTLLNQFLGLLLSSTGEDEPLQSLLLHFSDVGSVVSLLGGQFLADIEQICLGSASYDGDSASSATSNTSLQSLESCASSDGPRDPTSATAQHHGCRPRVSSKHQTPTGKFSSTWESLSTRETPESHQGTKYQEGIKHHESSTYPESMRHHLSNRPSRKGPDQYRGTIDDCKGKGSSQSLEVTKVEKNSTNIGLSLENENLPDLRDNDSDPGKTPSSVNDELFDPEIQRSLGDRLGSYGVSMSTEDVIRCTLPGCDDDNCGTTMMPRFHMPADEELSMSHAEVHTIAHPMVHSVDRSVVVADVTYSLNSCISHISQSASHKELLCKGYSEAASVNMVTNEGIETKETKDICSLVDNDSTITVKYDAEIQFNKNDVISTSAVNITNITTSAIDAINTISSENFYQILASNSSAKNEIESVKATNKEKHLGSSTWKTSMEPVKDPNMERKAPEPCEEIAADTQGGSDSHNASALRDYLLHGCGAKILVAIDHLGVMGLTGGREISHVLSFIFTFLLNNTITENTKCNKNSGHTSKKSNTEVKLESSSPFKKIKTDLESIESLKTPLKDIKSYQQCSFRSPSMLDLKYSPSINPSLDEIFSPLESANKRIETPVYNSCSGLKQHYPLGAQNSGSKSSSVSSSYCQQSAANGGNTKKCGVRRHRKRSSASALAIMQNLSWSESDKEDAADLQMIQAHRLRKTTVKFTMNPRDFDYFTNIVYSEDDNSAATGEQTTKQNKKSLVSAERHLNLTLHELLQCIISVQAQLALQDSTDIQPRCLAAPLLATQDILQFSLDTFSSMLTDHKLANYWQEKACETDHKISLNHNTYGTQAMKSNPKNPNVKTDNHDKSHNSSKSSSIGKIYETSNNPSILNLKCNIENRSNNESKPSRSLNAPNVIDVPLLLSHMLKLVFSSVQRFLKSTETLHTISELNVVPKFLNLLENVLLSPLVDKEKQDSMSDGEVEFKTALSCDILLGLLYILRCSTNLK
ncbi:unnamed protein product, partial [Meganyctiphanes norvegica]